MPLLNFIRLKAAGGTLDGIFEEIPIIMRNSQLTRALLVELQTDASDKFDSLDLSTHGFLEKNVRFLMDCVDDLSG